MVEHKGTHIESVGEYKYLGILLDKNLKFDRHVQYVRRKCIGRLNMLGKLWRLVGQEVSLDLYKSLITPLLDYGGMVYDCLTAKDSAVLQQVQNCALRIILQADRRTHVADMHRNLGMMYTSDRRHLHTMLQTYKCVNKLAPTKVCSQLRLVEERHDRRTRATTQQQLDIPFRKLALSKKAFRIRAPSLWTLVDQELRNKLSIDSFKYGLMRSDTFDIVS